VTDRLRIPPHEFILDAPPVGREIEFYVDIQLPTGEFRPLQKASPVVRALATEQFDDLVKRVRIFIHPKLMPRKEQILSTFQETLVDRILS